MNRRQQWRAILDAETARWQAKSYRDLASELRLRDPAVYVVQHGTKEFQVEVELIELNSKYAHVVVSVDDGSLPASLMPASSDFAKYSDKGDT